MSTGTLLVKQKRCATCNFWQHPGRAFNFCGKAPVSVKFESNQAPCMADTSRKMLGGGYCPRWTKWVLIP